MFDNLSISIENFETKDFYNLIENHVKKYPKKRTEGWFQSDWQNLRINYFPNQKKIRLTNSIHKFYNSEIFGLGVINHNNFTMSQVTETISYLETAFNRSSSEMRILAAFEYGLNIDTENLNPYNDIIERYQSCVTTATNPFYAFYNKTGKPYAKFCAFTHYKIKAYNKSKQSKLYDKNILRFEIVNHSSTRTREVFGKENIFLEDLNNVNIWNSCFETLIKAYDSIRVLAYPIDGIEAYTKTLCHSFPTLKHDYKKELRNISHNLKQVHDTLKNSLNNPHGTVRKKLVENYQNLIIK